MLAQSCKQFSIKVKLSRSVYVNTVFNLTSSALIVNGHPGNLLFFNAKPDTH